MALAEANAIEDENRRCFQDSAYTRQLHTQRTSGRKNTGEEGHVLQPEGHGSYQQGMDRSAQTKGFRHVRWTMCELVRRFEELVHFARVHGVMVEENEQLPADDPRRKFKYRVVLLGNQVNGQDMADTMFRDLGSSPATFEASHVLKQYPAQLQRSHTPKACGPCETSSIPPVICSLA